MVNKRFFLVEKSKTIANGSSENPSDDIACTGIGGQLPIGNGKINRPEVIGNDPDGSVGILICTVFLGGKGFDFFD